MVTPLMVTVPSLALAAGMTLLGLISKTRDMLLPLMATLPPLLFAMASVRPVWLAVAFVKICRAPRPSWPML